MKDIKTAKLSQIAYIRQGYQFRKSIENVPSGDIKVIQMADIIDNYSVNWSHLFHVHEENINPLHFLKDNDILFCSRGINNYNIVLEKVSNPMIAVSQFLVIKTDDNAVNPGYLSWYLNQPEAMAYFKKNTLTSTVPLINKSTLNEMMIPLPSLQEQKIIAEINKLSIKEKDLIDLINDKRKIMINQILRQRIE